MPAVTECSAMIAGILGGWEIVMILAVVLILFGAKRLPPMARGMGEGFSEFRRAIVEKLDGVAHDAGRSVGGIYGRPAAEALTPDNQTAELYDPAVLRGGEEPKRVGVDWICRRRIWMSIVSLLSRLRN